MDNYYRKKHKYDGSLIIGHNRNAVITENFNGRKGCTMENCCLWGCKNDSIYNATIDLKSLQQKPNFSYIGNVFVKKVIKTVKRFFRQKSHKKRFNCQRNI